MHAENYPPFREAAQLLVDFTAELAVVHDAHARALQQLAVGPESPPPMSVADAARALLAGDTPATQGTAMARLQLEEFELRQRLQRMTPMARQLAERVEIERDKARRAFLETEPRLAQIRDAWAAAESALRSVVGLESALDRDIRGNALGVHEFVRPFWANVEAL